MFHLLKAQDGKLEEAENKELFLDLNIDQIIEKICDGWGEDVKALYFSMPLDLETQEYRRSIFTEIREKALLTAFVEFLERMRMRSTCLERMEKVEAKEQRQTWFLRGAACYVEALEGLKAALSKQELISKGLLGLRETLTAQTKEAGYSAFFEETMRLSKELFGFRVLLTYEKDRFLVTEGTGKGTYDAYLKEQFPKTEALFKSPFLSDFDLSDLETEILHLFEKNHKEFFTHLKSYEKQWNGYAREVILALPPEISFYVAYFRFLEKMRANGFTFCTPKISKGSFSVLGLYDLALAIHNMESDREVISNDAEYEEGERFFVLTGPNQGGKTTFARSLGQLVYFTKMGLDVPAAEATLPYYKELLTHFSVEESSDTGRGKLMDELERLKPMMEKTKEEAFVVINELFTTAANYDACIMGKRVLEYFIGQGFQGIYVTHLSELSKACDGVVSLRAMVDENMTQTYRIAKSEAKELAGAITQVEKYGLTYLQIKERFS